MNILVTGATGFIGSNLALKLANNGNVVHALYRSEDKAKILKHENIRLFKGDILDISGLTVAIKTCKQVYHIAAYTDVWAKNPEIIYDLNVRGAINIFETALQEKVENIVFTSTAGVLGPSISGTVNEKTEKAIGYFLEYERTKALVEALVREYVDKGLNIKIVNPTRVYGPGLLSKSNSVTKMINSYSKGKWRIIPGDGKSIGNYVFIEDVVNGHVLAMQKGKAGERYLLGGENVDYLGFFHSLKRITGKNLVMFKFPLPLMLFITYVAMFINKVLGIRPFMTPALVRKFNYNWNISSQKAIDELGYQVTSLDDGIKKTIYWIKENNIK